MDMIHIHVQNTSGGPLHGEWKGLLGKNLCAPNRNMILPILYGPEVCPLTTTKGDHKNELSR